MLTLRPYERGPPLEVEEMTCGPKEPEGPGPSETFKPQVQI
jgi:hypothetical protein